ncbi:TIGR03749 family integrating conjugative element protein (plasmid) [Maricurvus nonylphenolicus]|uniref:TIGR03749 family integrating conjugative element protein n=1 Tax=Maricurvus nonylphenolicus TaxID=1008307 RepID=UPI0036F3643D
MLNLRNNPMQIIVALFALLLISSMALADPTPAAERIVWDKRPIAVHIQGDQERIIHFPSDVRYWLPDSLQRKVSVVSANGVLYIRAAESFPATRIRVQSLIDQTIYLLDVTANDAKSVSDELVIMKPDGAVNQAKDQTQNRKADDWRVRLTRYAAQQLYAPERLLRGDSQIKRIPIDTEQSIPLVRGHQLNALPIAAWQGGGYTVTAIKLRNNTQRKQSLVFSVSPKTDSINLASTLRGRWLTAATQHEFLGAAGNDTDTTTLYLVSDRPFIESLGFVAAPNKEVKEATDG